MMSNHKTSLTKKRAINIVQNPIILFEDNHLLIVSKPSSMLVQVDITGDPTLKDWAEQDVAKRFNKPGKAFIGLPHRLDRPSSGIVVLAKTSKALTRISGAFADRSIKKVYWAVVEGIPLNKDGRLIHSLWKDGVKKKSFVSSKKEAKEAILSYNLLSSGDRYSLLEINLETGRYHQIRCQLNAIGHPIKGDLKYGAKRPNPNGAIHLHAQCIEFKHPVKDEMIKIIAPTPQETLWIELNKKIKS